MSTTNLRRKKSTRVYSRDIPGLITEEVVAGGIQTTHNFAAELYVISVDTGSRFLTSDLCKYY